MYNPKDYEIFTQAFHQKIISEQGYQNVEVQHNRIFVGKSGANHQVDVCWFIDIGNVKQLFCVECKMWKKEVKKEHVASFSAKLDDIGNARGIFVTTKGYQIGATRLAKHKGIVLMNANYEIESKDAYLSVLIPQFSDVRVNFEEVTEDLLREIDKMANLTDAERTPIYDSCGSYVCNLGDIVKEFSNDYDGFHHRDLSDRHIIVFEHLVRITSVSYKYQRNEFRELRLKGNYKVANAKVRYIFDDKEVFAVLNSHL